MFNGDFSNDAYLPKNSELRQEYSRRLRERAEERQVVTDGRQILPPIPTPAQIEAPKEERPTPMAFSAPSILQRFGSISFSGGDWLILGLLIFFLFLADETDYIMVGILAYLLLSD